MSNRKLGAGSAGDMIYTYTSSGGTGGLVAGLTPRDYFAAAALQGYLASVGPHTEPVEYAPSITRDAYILADAMLEARK
mgnify:CR=1 FL=1